MTLTLKKAHICDSVEIHSMQIAAFKPLLDKYEDYDTNPGAESLEKVRAKFNYDTIEQYLIQLCTQCNSCESIGYMRVRDFGNNEYKLTSMFIMPKYQGSGYAQEAIFKIQSLYPNAKKWMLDTIKQEEKLCYLYEKMGFRLTGVEINIKAGMDLVDYEKLIV